MKEHIQKVHDMRQSAVGLYRTSILEKMKEEISVINSDRYLSVEGKAAKISQVRDKYRINLYHLTHAMRAEMNKELSAAEAKARAVLDKPTNKPDDAAIAKFSLSMNELKTELMLHPTTSAKALQEFAGSVADPHFASMLRGEFAGLLSSVQIKDVETQAALTKTWESLKTVGRTPEMVEAEKVMEQVTMMRENPNTLGLAVEDHVRSEFGVGAASVIARPDVLEQEIQKMGAAA